MFYGERKNSSRQARESRQPSSQPYTKDCHHSARTRQPLPRPPQPLMVLIRVEQDILPVLLRQIGPWTALCFSPEP